MKRYEKYKDSGIQWIGDVPNHWNYSRIKFGLKSSFSGVWGEDEKEDENDVVCYRVADFDYKNGGLSEEKITIRNIDEKTFREREVLLNDILIEKSGGGDVNPVGRAVIVNLDHKATCSNFMHCVRCNENVLNNRLLYYFFYSIYAQKMNLLFFNQTTGIQNLKVPEYLGQVMFLPPLSEQKSIASFLDAKTKPIDDIIAKRERQIELLEEMKSAIISHAVTKGLNPDAKMKKNGIEWIGGVPEGWELRKLKFIVKSEKYSIKTGPFGTQLKGDDLKEQGDVPVYNQRNVIDNQFDNPRLFVTQGKAEELYSFHTKPNDILITSRGTIGRAAILPKGACEGILHPCLIALRINRKLANLEYLLYYINGFRGFGINVFLESNATTIEVIYTETLKNIIVTLPPLSEQQSIAAYLDTETSKLDARIARRRKQIELLQEYKQALITDAVTGKIDVRGFNS